MPQAALLDGSILEVVWIYYTRFFSHLPFSGNTHNFVEDALTVIILITKLFNVVIAIPPSNF